MKLNKPLAAILGLSVGIVTLPLSIFAWPLACAAFLWNEADEEE